MTSDSTSSIEPVGVPTSPGYAVLFPPMVMRVRSALSPFSGWTLQTTAVVGWDLFVGNGKEGVGAFDALAFVGTGANALA